MSEQTRVALKSLKLSGMAQSFDELICNPTTLTLMEGIGIMAEREIAYREQRRVERLLKNAKLRFNHACPEKIDFQYTRALNQTQFRKLLDCEWIRLCRNVLFTGATGLGKSWLTCALGQQACRLGFSVFYIRVCKLIEKLRIAHADGSYTQLLMQMAKTNVLILDDWGLDKLDRAVRTDLLEILEDRHNSQATIITTQLPISEWHDYIGDPSIADAILDRFLSNSYRFELVGDSMRKTKFIDSADHLELQ